MKIRKFQIGGYNNSISSFISQQNPNLTHPIIAQFNQSLMNSAPSIFNKKISTNLVDPKSQLVNTNSLSLRLSRPNMEGYLNTLRSNQKRNNFGSIAPMGTAPSPITSIKSSNPSLQNPTLANTTPQGVDLKGNKFNMSLGQIGQIADIGSALLGPTNSDPTTQTVNAGYDLLSDVAMKVNPLVGTIMKGADFLQSGLNKLTRGYTTVENSKYGFDKVMSGIPILGMLNAFGKSSIAGSNTDIAKTIDMGYTPADEVKKSQIGSGTKFFAKIFGGKDLAKEQRNLVQRTDVENIKKSAVVGANKEWLRATQNSAPNVLQRNLDQLAGGYSPQTMKLLAAKRGTKLFHLSNIKNEVTRKLQRGGTMNVIPDGAFHSRKNNIDLDGITHKGIPVVSMEDGGEVTQHAEIEREELIFRKELTDIVEEAYKKYKEGDESVLLELGKLLTYEILENTEDNVGLLETVQ